MGAYPIAKALAEKAVIAANGIGGLETVVVRPRFIWGKGDKALLRQFTDAVKQHRFAWVNGGRYLTSTVHVDNVVEANRLAASAEDVSGDVFNIACGERISLLDIIGKSLPRPWLWRPFTRFAAWLYCTRIGQRYDEREREAFPIGYSDTVLRLRNSDLPHLGHEHDSLSTPPKTGPTIDKSSMP